LVERYPFWATTRGLDFIENRAKKSSNNFLLSSKEAAVRIGASDAASPEVSLEIVAATVGFASRSSSSWNEALTAETLC
jgi:hypothetical protein